MEQVSRWVVGVAVSVTIVIALCAFWLSFAALSDLAHRSGIAQTRAWVWPMIVDGMIVAGTVAIVALSDHEPRARRYPWAVLVGGAIVSVSANAAHAVYGDSTARDVPVLVAALVASVAPVALLVITHLTVLLTRKIAPAPRARRSPAQVRERSWRSEEQRVDQAQPPRSAKGRVPDRAVLQLALAEPDDVDLGAWFAERERTGAPTTGADVAAVLGVSAATGRRRLAALRARRAAA